MNTLEVMEEYARVCDDLDAFMMEENRLLRLNSELEQEFMSRKKEAVKLLTETLQKFREAAMMAQESFAAREARDRVLQKLLKLLLLSRESEQLLLKNAMPRTRAAAAVVGASPSRLHRTYLSAAR